MYIIYIYIYIHTLCRYVDMRMMATMDLPRFDEI